MNRNGLLSGYTDLQFSALLVILLVLFGLAMYDKTNKTVQESIQEDIDWEAQWLANAVARHPVQTDAGTMPISQALASAQIDATAAQQHLTALWDQVQVPRMREDDSGTKLRELHVLSGEQPLTPQGDLMRNYRNAQDKTAYLRGLRTTHERTGSAIGYSITPGAHPVFIAVSIG